MQAPREALQERGKTMKIKELKKGDFFTKKPLEYPKDSQVWIRGEYDRSAKKYECHRFDDVNTFCYLSGAREVYNDMIF